MESKKSVATSVAGSLSSIVPILFSACKSGACIGVCVSPVASIFGISSATLAASPWLSVLEPVLIALSAVSFTVSYYSIYVLPKLNCGTGTCACAPSASELRRARLAKATFWIGLVLSIGFLSYFEYTKYQSNKAAEACGTGCSAPVSDSCESGCTEGQCETDSAENVR